MDKQHITKFIGQHGIWKSRLRQAIDSGKNSHDIGSVRRDDQCEFGKWLKELPPQDRTSQHYRSVSSLHSEFHREAARVLELVAAGKKAEAEKALGSGGSYAAASSKLTQEMTAWMNSL
jgi:hypothetical protein